MSRALPSLVRGLRRLPPATATMLLAVVACTVPATADDGSGSHARPRRVLTLFGADAGAPHQLAASVALLVAGREDPVELSRHSLSGDGLILRLEPGLQGGAVGVGKLTMAGAVGYSIEALAVRTWGDDPWLAEPHTTSVGLRGSLYAYGLHLRAGPLYAVGGDDEGSWAATVAVGVGF